MSILKSVVGFKASSVCSLVSHRDYRPRVIDFYKVDHEIVIHLENKTMSENWQLNTSKRFMPDQTRMFEDSKLQAE